MKNSLFRKILAVGATLALVSSFFVAVPVSATPGCNTWGDIGMPVFDPFTEPGVMAVTPDGSLMFIALYYETGYDANLAKGTTKDNTWEILYSEDGGFTWKDTKLNNGYLAKPGPTNLFDEADRGSPVKILVSPMWPNNKNVYVALNNGDVWRLPDAGKGTPAPLNRIVSNKGTYLNVMTNPDNEVGGSLWDMDIWADGTYNYLAVATDLDVFVIKDQLLNDWTDYELNTNDDDDYTANRRAAAVRFAPDFATSELLWAVVTENTGTKDAELVLTSADSPSRWAYVFEEEPFKNYENNNLKWEWVPFVDIEFDAAYTAANPQMYVGIAPAKDLFYQKYGKTPRAQATGNIFRVNANAVVGAKGTVEVDWMYFGNRAFGSIEVSGDTIMALDYATGEVLTTTNAGATWTVATRNPAAPFVGDLLMAPDFAQSGTVYAAVKDFNWYLADGSLANYFGVGISGLYRSTDGGVFFDGISLLDMTITKIVDLAFDPKGGSQPVLMVLDAGIKGDFIFYTADATVKTPRWLMKDGLAAYETEATKLFEIEKISWDEAGNTVMFIGHVGPKAGPADTYYIYRSTDEGNSFRRWRDIPTLQIQAPADWYVVDASTVSIIGTKGYWGVKPFGSPVTRVANFGTDTLNSIARQGDDIAIGTTNGNVYVSTDAGNTWSDVVSVVATGTANTFVAFGPDGVLYAVAGNGTIGTVASINVGATIPAPSVVAKQNGKLNLIGASGIWVSPDNTLYVMGTPSAPTSGNTIGEGTIILGKPELSLTPPLSAPAYDVATSNKIVLSPIVVTNNKSFGAGETLTVVSADVKATSSSRASGTIWVEGANATGYFTINVYDNANPFAMFGLWPADISVEFDGVTVAAAGTDPANPALSRLLIGEKYNAWEQVESAGTGLWGTTGSNILWTLVNSSKGIKAFEDFNSGKVQNVTVKEVDKNASKATKTLEVSWSALACTSCYEIYVYVGDDLVNVVPAPKQTTDGKNFEAGTALSAKLTNMDYATKYDVQVRACVGGPLQSRLSDKVSATTDCYNVAPTPQVPVQGMQNASLAPSFVWAAPTAGCAPAKYDFQLSTDPNFGSFIIDTTVTGTGYTYTARDLAYDTNHYWRVRSVAADGTTSAWTTVQNFHTMVEPVEPTQAPDVTLTVTQNPAPVVTVSIPPQQTVTVPPAVTLTQTVTSVPTPTLVMPEQPTPAYIWVIVAVGAVLTIAVIVLIIRTRRAE